MNCLRTDDIERIPAEGVSSLWPWPDGLTIIIRKIINHRKRHKQRIFRAVDQTLGGT